LLSNAGSAGGLNNGIKKRWRLARKILFLVLTVIREILALLADLHLEIAKKTFLLPAALSNLTRPSMFDPPLTTKLEAFILVPEWHQW